MAHDERPLNSESPDDSVDDAEHEPELDATPTHAEQRMLELMYEVFEATGKWPTFQYLSGRVCEELDIEARDVYLDLAERDLVSPATRRHHEFQLREDTTVGVSLQGLMLLPAATDDLDRLVAMVRYIAERAATFRPAAATEPAQLTISDEEIGEHLNLDVTDTTLARAGSLLREQAWQLQTSSSWGESGWSLTVDIERARRYRRIESLTDLLAISYPAQAEPNASAVPLAAAAQTASPSDAPPDTQASRRRVMVVYGRDPAAGELFELLRALDLQPIEWADAIKQTRTTRPYTGQAVEAAFASSQAAVLLLVPEEKVALREDLRDPKDPADRECVWQPRPNVLYESGIAVTAHPERTIVVELGRPRRPSDLEGIHAIRIDPKPKWRHELAERLRAAGCAVNTDGSDWLEAGDFNEPELD